MRAWVLESHSGPTGLVLRDVPEPVPADEEVVVEIRASALNRADLLQCQGRYPGPPMEHEIPGLELSGEVVAMGAGANRFALGSRVAGLAAGAAFAGRIALHQDLLLPIPSEMSFSDAAALPEAMLTAYDALVHQATLAAGGRVLIHAGASGVGTAAVQIARELGALVAATCSPGKQQRVLDLGAECAVDSRDATWTEAIRAWAPQGVDVILDLIGAPTVPDDLDLVARRGRIVVLGLLGGARTEIDLAKLLTRRASLIGSVLRSRSLAEKTALVRDFEAAVLPAVVAGRLRAVLDSTWAFGELPRALEHLATNQTFGKIVIELDQGPE